jgi:hypothetical protein
VAFSSAPDERLYGMESWASRINGGIAPFGLYFILHKKELETSGVRIDLDPAHWFDGLAWKWLDDRYKARYDRIRQRQQGHDGGKGT